MELNGEHYRDEDSEERDKLNNMSPYQRLSYIKSLAQFYKEIKDIASKDILNEFIDRVLKATEDY